MIERRPFAELGGEELGWLDTRTTSRSPVPRPRAHGLGRAARVERRRDRRRAPAFRRTRMPTWKSSPMSAQGAITHEDSLGNKGRTEAGDVQVMAAGTGIRHAEYNRETEPTRIFQIWIIPTGAAARPSWGAQAVSEGRPLRPLRRAGERRRGRRRRPADPRRRAGARRHAEGRRDSRVRAAAGPARLSGAGVGRGRGQRRAARRPRRRRDP